LLIFLKKSKCGPGTGLEAEKRVNRGEDGVMFGGGKKMGRRERGWS